MKILRKLSINQKINFQQRLQLHQVMHETLFEIRTIDHRCFRIFYEFTVKSSCKRAYDRKTHL